MSAVRAAARLAALDLRLAARGLFDPFRDMRPATRAGLAIALVFVVHAAAWPVALWLGARENGPDGAAFAAAAARTGVLFVVPWAIASPMSAFARGFAQPGDLELLLASPLDVRAALAARLVAFGLEGVVSPALLLLPLADVAALQGRPHWLALYPALAATGLVGAALGLALALALNVTLGPRRARVVSQVVAAAIGASAIVAAQVAAFLPDGLRASAYGALQAAPAAMAAFAVPERAAAGERVALALYGAMALAAWAIAAATLARPFANAALRSAGIGAVAGGAGAGRFTTNLGAALRRKEHRLLWRDPWLLSQMILQALYSLPIGLILWRNGGVTANPGVAFAPSLVVIAGQLSASLAWISLCGEDAPDFLASAPATRTRIERAKLAAIALPAALALGLPLAALALASPRAGATALAFALAAGAASALLILWRQAPARRGLVLRRHSQSKLVALIEHWLSLNFAIGAALATLGSFAAAAPLGFAALTLWLSRPRRRKTPATLR